MIIAINANAQTFKVEGYYNQKEVTGIIELSLIDSTVTIHVDDCCANRNKIIFTEKKKSVTIFALDDDFAFLEEVDGLIIYRGHGFILETKIDN